MNDRGACGPLCHCQRSELGHKGDGSVQTGEAASAAAIAGGHVDGHSLAADLDRLLGAGIFAQQAVVALTGLAARLYPDPGLHLAAEAEIQCARGAGSGAAAAIAALATGEIQHWGTGDGAAVLFGAIGGLDEAVGTRLEAVATTGAEGEELGLVDGPGRACLMADHLGSAGAPPCVCQPATEKMRHAHLYTY